MKKSFSFLAGAAVVVTALSFTVTDASPFAYMQYVQQLQAQPSYDAQPTRARVYSPAVNAQISQRSLPVVSAQTVARAADYKDSVYNSRVFATTNRSNYSDPSLPLRPSTNGLIRRDTKAMMREMMRQRLTSTVATTAILADSGMTEYTQYETDAFRVEIPSPLQLMENNVFANEALSMRVQFIPYTARCGQSGSGFDACVESLFAEKIAQTNTLSLQTMQQVVNERFFAHTLAYAPQVQTGVKLRSFYNTQDNTFNAWYAIADVDGDIYLLTIQTASSEVPQYMAHAKHIFDSFTLLSQLPQYVQVSQMMDTTTDIEAKGYILTEA